MTAKISEELQLRSALADDAPRCAGILNDWIDATPWMPRCHKRDDIERHYREFVFPRREVHVIGTPVEAYIALSSDNFITSLFCAQPGQGYGKVLVDRAKELRGVLWLWTFVANAGARRFYEREGFTERRRTEGDNEEKLPDILYHWSAP